ncbi:hypothetical protein NQ315_016571 [Exocentrus adspersus]|uniref:Fatty acyl-CoA reductase n=1 Tax=Exocentrus adspersus TaxID=1586481 RepID=A0AAV8VYK7_9CUCU|nr:hypothetical protein NQ315_016571 [Exocentrus adspersus]
MRANRFKNTSKDYQQTIQKPDVPLQPIVNVIFHSAATIRFDEPLRRAVLINIRAVRDMVQLAHEMPNLKSFIHLSTAYSNCIHQHIMEEIYPPAADYRKLLQVVESPLPDNILEKITPMLIGKYPNTYSYSKQIGEAIIMEEGKGLPIGVHRPTIVMGTYEEPLMGWINSFYTPTGYLALIGIGVIRTTENILEVKPSLIPVDMVVNSVIATACNVAERYGEQQKQKDILVYNYENTDTSALSWADSKKLAMPYFRLYPPVIDVWYPLCIYCETHTGYVIASFFLHKLPAILVDAVLFCLRKPVMVVKAYKKIDKFTRLLRHFAVNEWTFESNNTRSVINSMSEEDRKLFPCDLRNLDWEKYMERLVIGTRIYLLKDPMDTLPQARKNLRR